MFASRSLDDCKQLNLPAACEIGERSRRVARGRENGSIDTCGYAKRFPHVAPFSMNFKARKGAVWSQESRLPWQICHLHWGMRKFPLQCGEPAGSLCRVA